MPSDDEVKEFFDRLEESCFHLAELKAATPSPALQDFREFRRQCEERERAGRETFKGKYLTRDNCTEATEEFADGALYSFFDILQARDLNAEEDWHLALTAAYHAAQAHRYSRFLRSRYREQYSDSQS